MLREQMSATVRGRHAEVRKETAKQRWGQRAKVRHAKTENENQHSFHSFHDSGFWGSQKKGGKNERQQLAV